MVWGTIPKQIKYIIIIFATEYKLCLESHVSQNSAKTFYTHILFMAFKNSLHTSGYFCLW